MNRRQALTVIGSTLAAMSVPRSGLSAFPDRPLRLIVPNAAGGSADINARLIARSLEAALGQSVAVVNMPGGGTSIGARNVKDVAPDGYTALFIHQALLVACAMGVADFKPMDLDVAAQTGEDVVGLIVGKDSRHKTLGDLVEAARHSPNTLRFAVQIGALNHFMALAIGKKAGVTFRHVNIGGGGPTRNALLGNHVDMAIATWGEVRSFLASGDLRMLAVFGTKRHPLLPQVPTGREQNVDFTYAVKYWWWLPRKVPEGSRETLVAGLQKAMRDKDLLQRFEQAGLSPKFVKGADAARDVAAEFDEMEKLAMEFGLR